MKVIVLGAGVVGVTTAWYLARQGVETRVLDRQPGPGLETSFANAGELSYGMTSPWAAPGIPMKAVKWLFMRHRPLFIWPLISPTMSAAQDADELQRGLLPAEQGPDGADLELQPRCADRPDGRNSARLRPARAWHASGVSHRKAAQGLEGRPGSAGELRYQLLDREACVAVEPGLGLVREKFVGGLRLLADRTGDCRMFTLALAEKAAELGVSFHMGSTSARWRSPGGGSRASRPTKGARPPTPMSARSDPMRRS